MGVLKCSTREIQSLVERLKQGAAAAVLAMESGRERADQGVVSTRDAERSLEAITGAVTRINATNLAISTAMQGQRTISDEVQRRLEVITSLAAESSMGAQRLQEQQGELSLLSDRLRALVGRFKLGGKG